MRTPLRASSKLAKTKTYDSSEMLAINDRDLLLLERDGEGLGDGSSAVVKRIYRFDIRRHQHQCADRRRRHQRRGQPVEVQVGKTLFLDLRANPGSHGIRASSVPAKRAAARMHRAEMLRSIIGDFSLSEWRYPLRRTTGARPMMMFDDRQFDAMRKASRERVLGELEAHLRARLPHWAWAFGDAGSARAWLEAALSNAEAQGFTRVIDARRYVEYAALYGRDFVVGEEGSWAAQALARRDLAPVLRLELLDIAERIARPVEAIWRR